MKGKISFTIEDTIIEEFKIIAIKKKMSASSLAEECLKQCIKKNKDLL